MRMILMAILFFADFALFAVPNYPPTYYIPAGGPDNKQFDLLSGSRSDFLRYYFGSSKFRFKHIHIDVCKFA